MEEFILQFDTDPSKMTGNANQKFSPHLYQKTKQKFQDLVILPNIIKDREYLMRKKTFDTFLKQTDSEFLNMYLKYDHNSKKKTQRNMSSQNKGSDNHRSQTSQNEATIQKNRGKILSNEFWSENYYRSIMNSSCIRERFEKIVNEVKLRKFETKIKITDDYYKKKHQSFFARKSILATIFSFEYDYGTPYLRTNGETALLKTNKKNFSRSSSEWISSKQREFDSKVENLKENVDDLIKNCNNASNSNQALKK